MSTLKRPSRTLRDFRCFTEFPDFQSQTRVSDTLLEVVPLRDTAG